MSEPIKNIKPEIWFIDIEYVPCLTTGRRVYNLPAETTDEEVLKTMYAEAGATEENPQPMLKSVMYRIVSIAALVRKLNGELNLRLFSRPADDDFDEAKIIQGFLEGIGNRKPQIVGFATTSFDLPTIFQRAVINGISAPNFCERPNKPWDNEPDYFSDRNDWNVDLLRVLSTYGKATPKLAEIAQACGIPAKVGGDGAQVAEMWFTGKRREIVNYNECDVLTTYLLWLQIVRTCGLLDAEDVHAEETLLLNLLTSGKDEKPHLGEFLEKWNSLKAITEPASIEAGDDAAPVSTLSPEERAELEARVQSELSIYALGDEAEIQQILDGRTLNERSDAELAELLLKYGPKVPEAEPVEEQPKPEPPIDTQSDVEPVINRDNTNIAMSLSDMISVKQLGMIRGLAKQLGRTADSVSAEICNAKANELSKRAASDVIRRLQESIKSKGVTV